jgi:hypothetical protein
MSYMYGLFDNEQDVRQALDGLERLGIAEDVVEVITQPADTGTAATGEAPVVNTPLIPVAGVSPAATTTAWSMSENVSSRYLDGLGEAGDYFQSALQKGGQIIVVDTPETERVGSLFREANAQKIYDKRLGRDV